MYPELFRIGNFPINTYGVFLALAFLCAILVTVKLAARDGLPREKIYDLSLWMLLASLIGSKILMLIVEPEYRENPMQLLTLDFLRSGGVFYGGLIGAIVVGILGAIIGGWLFGVLGVNVGTGLVAEIIKALIGAVLLLLILRGTRRL